MLVKTRPAKLLQDPANPDVPGTFEALVSVFDNVDSYGDVVRKGAFAKTLEEWTESQSPIPVLYSHNATDPDYNIGHVLEAYETDDGLLIRGQLDVESETGKAKQVHRLLTTRRVSQFSFAYDVTEGSEVQLDDGRSAYELRGIKLYEVGPCLIGANPATELISAKHRSLLDGTPETLARVTEELKTGRVLSSANEKRIRSALDELKAVLDGLTENSDEGQKSTRRSSRPLAEALERELAALL